MTTTYATLDGVSGSVIYLLYADDGATLVYAGPDAAEYERYCRELAPRYAGSVVGRRQAGRAEQWLVRAFFHAEPSHPFIKGRRRFPHDLTWEPSSGASVPDAADG